MNKNMTPHEKMLWFAGWFEGEGTIFYTRRNRKFGGVYLRMSGGSTDVDTIQFIHDNFGGHMKGPFFLKNEKHRPIWHWYLTETDKVAELAKEIYSYLSSRRKAQVDECLNRQRYAVYPSKNELFDNLTKEDGGCIFWTGHIDKYGFGTWQKEQGVRVQAHRYNFERLTGVTPKRLVNLCGSKHCVKPDHWRESKIYCTAEDES